MGVRGTEFFTQYFSGNVDVRVVDGFVEVTVGLTENGQVAAGGGSSWSGTGSGAGASSGPGSETFTFQLGPLKQVLFGEGSQGSQLQGQITGLDLQGLPEKFIERIQELEKDQPGKIPESVLGKIEEAIQEALDRLREQEAAAQGTRGEYDFRYSAGIIDGDLERGLPGFAPVDMDIPPLDPEPADTGGGVGSGGSTATDGLYRLFILSDPNDLDNKTPFDEKTSAINLTSSSGGGSGKVYILIEELVGPLGLEAMPADPDVVDIDWDLDTMILMIEAVGNDGGGTEVHIEGWYNSEIVEIVINISSVYMG
jgi:hypothetical protein